MTKFITNAGKEIFWTGAYDEDGAHLRQLAPEDDRQILCFWLISIFVFLC